VSLSFVIQSIFTINLIHLDSRAVPSRKPGVFHLIADNSARWGVHEVSWSAARSLQLHRNARVRRSSRIVGSFCQSFWHDHGQVFRCRRSRFWSDF